MEISGEGVTPNIIEEITNTIWWNRFNANGTLGKVYQIIDIHRSTYCFAGAALLALSLTTPFGVTLLSQTALSSVAGEIIAAAITVIESYICTNLVTALTIGIAALAVERVASYCQIS